MPTPKQIEANQQNAQSSTGPKTEAGKQSSSRNATRHGFTGQSLVLTDDEKEAYEFHCLAFMEQYAPATHEETDLTQQYADLRWTLHQISVQQVNLLALINSITTKFMKAGEIDGLAEATDRHYKTLNTLSIYETRRRRAAAETLQSLKALIEARHEALAKAAALYKANKAQGKPFNPTDFGFVCSLPEIQGYLSRKEGRAAEAAPLRSSASDTAAGSTL